MKVKKNSSTTTTITYFRSKARAGTKKQIRKGVCRLYNVRIAADSTMFLMVNLLMALSLGVQREQLEQRMGLT